MLVADVLKEKGRKLVTSSPDATIEAGAARMRSEGVGALILRNADGSLIGLVSEREIVLGIAQHGAKILKMPVSGIMKAETPVASPTDTIVATLRLMTDQRVRHLPVVEDGAVVGLVSIGDITKYRLAEKVAENDVLQDMARIRFAAA